MWKALVYNAAPVMYRRANAADNFLRLKNIRLLTLSSKDFSPKKKDVDDDLNSLLKDMYKDFEAHEKMMNLKKNPPILDSENKDVNNSDLEAMDAMSKDSKRETDYEDIKNDKNSDLDSLLKDMYKEFEESEKLISATKNPPNLEPTEENAQDREKLSGYIPFKDSDATVIYDVDEERRILEEAYIRGEELVLEKEKKHRATDKYDVIADKDDVNVVFSVEEMFAVMQGEKMKDIATIAIPASRNYADFLMIGTGRNPRHLYSTAQIVRKLYKKNASPRQVSNLHDSSDKGESGWIAMDLGNIVLHLFTEEQRDYYNLESLWTVGSKYDDLSVEEADPLAELMANHLSNLEPAEITNANQ